MKTTSHLRTIAHQAGAVLIASLMGYTAVAAQEAPRAALPPPAEQQSSLLKIAETRPLSADEQFVLSLAHLRQGAFPEALATARLTLGMVTNKETGASEKAAVYAVIAQCHGAMGNFRLAAEAALEGHRLNPTSKELGALRLAYWTKAGNPEQIEAAKDAMNQLVAAGQKVELTVGTIIVVVTVAKPVIEALADVYGDWYEAKLKAQYGNRLRVFGPTLPDNADGMVVELVARSLEKLWPHAVHVIEDIVKRRAK